MVHILHIIPRLRKGGAERLCLGFCDLLQKNNSYSLGLLKSIPIWYLIYNHIKTKGLIRSIL